MRASRLLLLAAALPLLAGCNPEPFGSGKAPDLDGDGFPAALDCDDRDATVFQRLPLYRDDDRDGVGAGEPVPTCMGAVAPAGWSLQGGDCAPTDPLAWRHVTQVHADRDGDGATVAEAVDLCVGAGAVPGDVTASLLPDCDDADPTLATWTALYPDADGDGVGVGPRAIACLGATRPAGFALAGLDGDDADPAVGRTFDDDDLRRLLD